MMETKILTPGHAHVCRGCAHRLPNLDWHPQPCGRVRWEGQRHVVPTLKRWEVDATTTCTDYVATEAAEQVPVTEGEAE